MSRSKNGSFEASLLKLYLKLDKKNKKQQYYCKSYDKRFIDYYTNNACSKNINNDIILLTKEGLGIRSTARVLQISTTTLLRRIINIARSIKSPPIIKGKIYEVDEMRSFIKNKSKLILIVYALDRKTRKVVSFAIGKRTKLTLQNVTNTLLLSDLELTNGSEFILSEDDKNQRGGKSVDSKIPRAKSGFLISENPTISNFNVEDEEINYLLSDKALAEERPPQVWTFVENLNFKPKKNLKPLNLPFISSKSAKKIIKKTDII